jgi:sugar/nucleoside kinase (ribokinase family)
MTLQSEMFDVAYIGNYTKDTIVTPAGESHVDGGGAHYAAVAGARLGLKVAAITLLSQADEYVVRKLEQAGVTVFARYTPESTCVRLEYPTADVDQRLMYITASAGAIDSDLVGSVSSRAAVLGTSVRGEVALETIRRMRQPGRILAADLQGFVRVLRGTLIEHAHWPEQDEVLACLDILKVDAVEAESLTGERDPRAACRALASKGPQEIVLTRKDGVMVYDHGAFHEAAFYPERMNGRSGRGDTCLGTYVAMRLSELPARATLWAAALTSLKIEVPGPFLRSRADVEQLLRLRYGYDPSAQPLPAP